VKTNGNFYRYRNNVGAYCYTGKTVEKDSKMEIKVEMNKEITSYWYDPEHAKDVLAFYENAYYKGKIDNLWIDGVPFEEDWSI
jgi:hypothetical protein